MAQNRAGKLFLATGLIAALMLSPASIPSADARECSYGPYTGR